MILYEEDYVTHRHIIDTKTKNYSFLRMYMLLKKMGIKNNKFFLVLTQPELQGVDPHSLDLTQDQQLKIAYECKVNPWYFFREVIRIGSSGGDSVPYQLNRANLALIWLFMNNIDIYLTMPRQIGKTIGTIGLNLYMMYLLGENMSIGLFAKDATLRQENVDRLKELRNNLPKYLYLAGQNYNTDNQEGLEYKKLHNKYTTFVAQTDRKKASGQGRGFSFAFEHWDELAYYTNNDLSYDSAIAATNTAGEQVRALGIPCANIITTTAGSLSDPWGKYAHKLRSKCFRYTEGLFDSTNRQELQAVVVKSSEIRMVYVEFGHKQLGKDDEWFKFVTRGKPQHIIDCDYLNKWGYGGTSSVVPKELLDKLSNHMQDPCHHEIVDGLMLRWYVNEDVLRSAEMLNTPLIITSDTSDNVGRDYTSIVLLNPADMSVVMTCRCNESNLAYIAKLLISFLKRFRRSILMPERNKNGAMMIDIILQHFEGDYGFDPFKRIFNTYVQNFNETSVPFTSLDITSGSVRKSFGFNTTSSDTSRKLLYSAVLMTSIKRNYARIFDVNIIDEIKGLTLRNGRVDHKEDEHDDTLVAWLIACFFVMYGKNHHMYGIDSSEILNVVEEDDKVDSYERHRREAIKKRIMIVEDTLKSNISTLLRNTLQSELTYLKTTIPEDEINRGVVSLHQVKQEVEKSSMVRDDFRLLNTLQFYY